jgi:hypothetical protein
METSMHGTPPLVRFAVVALAFAATPVRLQAQQDPPKPLIAAMDYLVRDGGAWEAENPRFDAETNPWRTFGYQLTWVFDSAAVRWIIDGRLADGRRGVFWELLGVWNPIKGAVDFVQIGQDGTMLRGMLSVREDGRQEIHLAGPRGNGSWLEFRDMSTRVDDNAFQTTPEDLKDGHWVPRPGLFWKRVARE